MNLVDIHVVEVLGPPEKKTYLGRTWWIVPVKADSWGHVFEDKVYKRTEEHALAVKVGYEYQG